MTEEKLILQHEVSGEKHMVQQSVFTVGSGNINNLIIDQQKARKLHFQILRQADGYRLIGMNGTVEINGKPVSEKELSSGDFIRIGDETLKVIIEAPFEQTNGKPEAKQALSYETLLNSVIEMLRTPDKKESYAQVLKTGVELMKADGGFLFSAELNSTELVHSIPEDNSVYSQSAIEAARSKGETIIWSASDSNEQVSEQSVIQKRIFSMLVAPLRANDGQDVVGFLYLHRRENKSPFTESERKLFSKISSVLGAVWESNKTQQAQSEQIEIFRQSHNAGDMIYQSPSMKRVVELGQRSAKSNVPILIFGETGTGKEVMARFIHKNSDRSNHPFVPINCGAIPENLIESELFGHEKGAFTGANNTRPGLFEQASSGTLFLDEIGELPLLMQVKFLRVLQENSLRRLGGQKELKVDVRVIAATNRNLQQEVHDGRFREDLFYRLNLVQLELPPLREREADILLLANHVLKKASSSFNMNTGVLSKAAEKALLKYAWPGNIRELENKVQKSLLHSSSRIIDLDSLDLPQAEAHPDLTLKAVKEIAERTAADRALRKAKGNLTLAASFLGIDRKVLRDLMERLGIKKENYKK